MKSKLFLVALAALLMGAFAMVGCEPAAEPAPDTSTTTQGTPDESKANEPATMEPPTEGGETATTEGGDTATTEGGATEGEHTEGDGHGHEAPTEGEGH